MIGSLRRDGQQDALQLAGGIQPVYALKIDLQRPQIRFVPARLDLIPWDGRPTLGVLADINAAAVDIVGDILQLGIAAKDECQVAQRVLHLALLVKLQFCLPVFVHCT